MKDYRNTPYKKYIHLQNICEKKRKLLSEVKKTNPNKKNLYDLFSNKENIYNKKFMNIYDFKCCYCGVSIKIIDKCLFEIDHFIPKTSKLFNTAKYKAGNINNLILSCRSCNRRKAKFEFKSKRKPFHPDKNINVFFKRDKDYSIIIEDKYKNDKHIKEFYNKLKLNFQIHRLDYLIMCMKDFCKEMKDEKIELYLNKIINILLEKRDLH